MNNEKIDYFFNEFDYLIQSGKKPREALLETAEDYAEVFYNKKETRIIHKDITIDYILNKIQENFKCNLLDIKSINLLTYYKYIIIFNNNKKFLLIIDILDTGILLFNYEEIKNDLIYTDQIIHKETKDNTKEFTDNLKKLSKEIHEQLEKLYPKKEIKNKILIEKIARIICKDHGYNPDQLIDYDYPRIDHQPHFIKKTYKWEEYSGIAKEILKEL